MIDNKDVADALLEIAHLLDEQQANPFRVSAYRRAATTVSKLDESVEQIVAQKGFDGLTALPGIGENIGRCIYEFVATGRVSKLETLRRGHDPVALFEKIPSIGPTLAHRLVEQLHLDSYAALEAAAHDGRLAKVPGFNAKKIELVATWLNQVLSRRPDSRSVDKPETEPNVKLLLAIDRQYRERSEQDALPTIAPQRFNADGRARLPILHHTTPPWHFTALYSNTARAHQLGKTRDWVVIYYEDEQHREGQNTVVTETHGTLIGRRVVRGRETECREYYNEGGDVDN